MARDSSGRAQTLVIQPYLAGAQQLFDIDYQALSADERAQVYIQIGGRETPAWAFASVTNNDTQQVTIVTADGAGGRP